MRIAKEGKREKDYSFETLPESSIALAMEIPCPRFRKQLNFSRI